MKILYIDTSSNYLYSGIVIDNTLKSEVKEKLDKDLSKEALPKIINLFEKAKIEPNKLDKIIVVTGPGSFTGIRIGVTIAKTISWALNIKIIPISGLTAMALSSNSKYKMPLIDARRNFVYGALYDSENKPIIEDSYINLNDLLVKTKDFDDVTIITNDNINVNLKIENYNPDLLKITNYFKDYDGINPHLVNPIYLKKTEAEEKAGL